ncbi:hypothetical protein FLAG1_12068 [Fusarium langsethiae]|uniref:PD-(D/E)XK nuclease-like domain-containing protein n=1 Tax=Fusarium langsethiae TaxID=179993 RepID=A0A0M9ELM4_FUSLA|nr:hypothetical protein FLAG1_12068 [Fusarium langsethiae]GKU16665.1 unnamed protein product [Fusarium langsethiae]
MSLNGPETPKRKAVDDDPTPRAFKITGSNNSFFEGSQSASSQSNTTNRSGRSSPVKAFPIRGAGGHVIDTRTMNPNAPGIPPDLKVLLKDFQNITMCYNFLPKRLQAGIEAKSVSDESLQLIHSFAYTAPDENVVTGVDDEAREMPVYLLLQIIDQIVDKAARCQIRSYDETGWNHLVHTPLMDAVFNNACWPGSPLANYSPCMNASITTSHHKFPIPSAKVDYVLYIDPSLDSDKTYTAIRQLQESLVEQSVNHTMFSPLRDLPICLSIETKKYGGDLKKGDGQLCSWQAAQWTALASLAGDGIQRLPFLPGVMVQGHEWKFVATTRRGDETVLWASAPIGSTMTSLGVLQIMAGLSRLRKWSVDVFWPWYKRYVLMMHASAISGDVTPEGQLGPREGVESLPERDSILV